MTVSTKVLKVHTTMFSDGKHYNVTLTADCLSKPIYFRAYHYHDLVLTLGKLIDQHFEGYQVIETGEVYFYYCREGD